MGKSDYTFRYKVRNWPEYNRALVKRGQLTLWFDTEAVAAWRHPGPFEGRGRPKVYADAAIQCALGHCQVNASRAETAPIYGQLTNL